MPDFGKIYRILEVLHDNCRSGISTIDISRTLDIPVSTCSRILVSLRKYDFAYKRPSDSKYTLGFAYLRFSQSILATNDEAVFSRPVLDELYSRIEETVFYAKYSGSSPIVIDVRGPVNPRIAVGLGEVMPLHCSAAGKAVLAFIPLYEREKIYKQLRFDQYTDNTTLDAEALESELDEIQKSHVAYNHGEYHEGINAMAVPVFNRFGNPIGSIAAVGTAARLTDLAMREKRHPLLAAAKRMSKQIIRE